jgi:HPt (histidine-containing phosphotransfer) domain-containing protein
MKTLESKLQAISKLLGEETVVDLLQIFEEQMAELIGFMLTWDQSHDLKRMAELSHKIKSSAMNVGALSLGEILNEIEKSPQSAGVGRFSIEAINREYLRYLENLGSWHQKLLERKNIC